MFNFFDKLKSTVSKTAQNLVGNVVESIKDEAEFSEFVLDDMEDLSLSKKLNTTSPFLKNFYIIFFNLFFKWVWKIFI